MGQLNHKDYVKERISAADEGTPEALYDLGLIYSIGQGVEQDNVEAHKYFNLAAIRGMKSAQIDRAEVAEYMSVAEIAMAQKMAREWLSTH
ncbi:hypothetical protein [Emcibacter sp.]|uniref:hypothetical protein n=1 Tax=Emcibacter sp. TaxID=1979954 RepID=UPI003A94FF8E